MSFVNILGLYRVENLQMSPQTSVSAERLSTQCDTQLLAVTVVHTESIKCLHVKGEILELGSHDVHFLYLTRGSAVQKR